MKEEDYYSQKPKRAEFLWKKGPDGGIMLRMINSQSLISLGPMGTNVFNRCDGKTTVAEIIKSLEEEYPHIPPYQIQHDTHLFLHWLQSLGLLLIYWEEF